MEGEPENQKMQRMKVNVQLQVKKRATDHRDEEARGRNGKRSGPEEDMKEKQNGGKS